MRELRDLVALAVLATLVGLIAGVVCVGFRLALESGEGLRHAAVDWAQGRAWQGLALLVAGCAAATAVAASLVRRIVPEASGSGIPRVEAVLDGEIKAAPAYLAPIKFVGGFLAISAGLALGREGPSVQMGANIADAISRLFRRSWQDNRALMAGGAGAGLATAFNAPGAGAIFVIEELVGRFEPRVAVVALGASVGAITVSNIMVGSEPVLLAPELPVGSAAIQPLYLLLGLLLGVLSVFYSRSLLATLNLFERIGGPMELRAAAIGAVIGVVAFVAPEMLGGGDHITQSALNGELLLMTLPMIFLLRLLLGAISYAAATPGGLFAPMLVLGSVAGLGFGMIADQIFPGLSIDPEAFAVVGMGAFFAGVVRAPLTGIVLVTEMTGSSSLLLPLLSGCFGSMLVSEALGDHPIYTSLRRRAARSER
ncbi:H(+)/Cl(-) exchange transporter ClcA [Tropicimonas sp. IMCC34043]|uniref:H(+)/Cl(-) exchange transporter ClcA n=1 Tax=Tropicimonas sp. IMCC34043 TaxID=2248760 RepID=UPI0018E5116B|nr:H(+)/Cl(-) exchange transporter ClcA [Tropicimonas sp. IMCC34043]